MVSSLPLTLPTAQVLLGRKRWYLYPRTVKPSFDPEESQ